MFALLSEIDGNRDSEALEGRVLIISRLGMRFDMRLDMRFVFGFRWQTKHFLGLLGERPALVVLRPELQMAWLVGVRSVVPTYIFLF